MESFFTSIAWRPTSNNPTYGALALIVGTASVTGFAMLFSVPLSLGAALFIAEFATGKTRETLKILVEMLAAIPSVVWGFVGMSIMHPLIIQIFNVPVGLNVLNAGLILGLMAAPIMTTIAEDALKAVPDTYREAAEALGATRWEVIVKVVIPASRNGLLAAVLLGVGRGFGETMAVLMASGHAINLPTSVFDSVRALTATIASELGDTVTGGAHWGSLFTLGILSLRRHFPDQPHGGHRGPRNTEEVGSPWKESPAHVTATPLNRRSYRNQSLAKAVFFLMTVVLVIPVLLIVGTLVVKGAPAISWEFLFTAPRDNMTAGGIFPCAVGTIWLVVVALLASVPVGVAAALYLSEYAPDNLLTRTINLAIINLAGVPSIVHALFGFGAFVLFFGMGQSILAASLTLAVMTLPVVIVATRESLQAVPQAFREACWNMGATRWQTIRKVVLPNSISGILTGVILEVSRTAGETAPIMFTGAAMFVPFLPESVFDQTMAMSYHLYNVATQLTDVPEELTFGVALVLISIVLLMNAVSIGFRVYLRGMKKW